MFLCGHIYIDIYFAFKLDFINIDLRETVNIKFEKETLKEVKENIEISINLKKIVLKR